MNRSAKLAFVEVREGKPRVRWGPYFLGLTIVVAAGGLLNGLLLAAGLWSGVDTVLFGLFASVVLFNVLVIYQFNRTSNSAPPNQPAASRTPPSGPPPSRPSADVPSQAGYCPRCGAALAAETTQGLCPQCLMALNVASATDVPTDAVGPGGTRAAKPPPAAPLPLAEIARHFPQLEILECLGRGGMGVVYKARQPHLNRLIALKILAPGKEQDPAFAQRFTREAQTLARLNHPHIVTLYDFGKVNGLFYLLMEYVDGVSLRQLLQTKKLAPEEALAIVPKICEALQYAHEHGVVHRDIKPENVLLNQEGRVKIADFGIVKIVGGEAGQPAITRDEQVIGTPHYMAPEQVEHPQRVDHRADIYSLGVVFYEMLTGELPLGKFAPPSRLVQVDVRLDEIVLHALEKQPERRYQHASDVKTDVETFGSTAAPVRSSAGNRSVRIPGTNLALVESRNGQRLVNWSNVSLALVLLMLAGAGGLGLIAVVANQIGFYVKPETFQTAGLVLTFVSAFFLSIVVRRALRLPADEFESPAPSAKSASETLDLERVKNARRLVRWPATGLTAIGFSYFVVAGCFFGFAHWPANWQDALGVCGVLAIIVINYVIILGASRMRQLQDYRLAVLAAIVSLVFALPGLPLAVFPIWALMVLYRPDVRAAFHDLARKGASEPAAPPASTSSVSVPRAGVVRKIVTGVAALALLLIAVAVGSKLLAVYGHSQARQQQVSAGAVVRVQEKLRREIQQRLAEGGWRLESLNVSVSPNLKRAECRLENLKKMAGENLFEYVSGTLNIRHRGGGLWEIEGQGQLWPVHFTVDASAEMSVEPGGAAAAQPLRLSEQEEAEPADVQAALAATFGPETEITLNDVDDLRGGEALDLDSRQLLDVPEDIKNRPESEQFQWIKEHSADVLLDNVNGRWGLLTTMDNELKLALLPNEKWEAITGRELSQALAAKPSGLETLQRRSWTVYVLATNAQPPLTFAFRTASGASGLLQITRFGEKPNCARLRYKTALKFAVSVE